MPPSSTIPSSNAAPGSEDSRLDLAVAKLRTDYEELVGDSRDVILEGARALALAAAELARELAAAGARQAGRAADAAWDQVRARPVTAASIAIAAASAALATALTCKGSRATEPTDPGI
jgi:hypothetical protein